jgi:inner membrane protein CreD
MSIKKIIMVVFIYLLASIGWIILGTSIKIRSDGYSKLLGAKVESLWGGVLVQNTPQFFIKVPGNNKVRYISPQKNEIEVDIDLDQRKKGLIWYPTYKCNFSGKYSLKNSESVTQKIRMHFDFPSSKATYDQFSLLLNNAEMDSQIDLINGISEIIELKPNEIKTIEITYTTKGLYAWNYMPDKKSGKIRNFTLEVNTDFMDYDFGDGSLSPDVKEILPDGKSAKLIWTANGLITNQNINITMPEKINPGPLSTRMTYFAPICLLFFFVLIAGINIIYKINVHPMHYLFIAAGFFAFHLLFAYLVDHLNITLCFLISTLTTVVLVTLYLKKALGNKFPWFIACAGQIFYLILFSYSFFLKGMTGLTVTIGAIMTLAAFMAVTAKIDWNEVFQKKARTFKIQDSSDRFSNATENN